MSIIECINSGKYAHFKDLLETADYAELMDTDTETGNNILHCAVLAGVEYVKLLVRGNRSLPMNMITELLNSGNCDKDTPLHLACGYCPPTGKSEYGSLMSGMALKEFLKVAPSDCKNILLYCENGVGYTPLKVVLVTGNLSCLTVIITGKYKVVKLTTVEQKICEDALDGGVSLVEASSILEEK